MEAYQDAGYIFYVINSYASRVTAEIVISIQTQLEDISGKQGLARRFFELWPEILTCDSQRPRLDIQKETLFFVFFFGDIGQKLDRVFRKMLVTPRKN